MEPAIPHQQLDCGCFWALRACAAACGGVATAMWPKRGGDLELGVEVALAGGELAGLRDVALV